MLRQHGSDGCFHPKQAHQNRISMSGSVLLIKMLLHLCFHYSRCPIVGLLMFAFSQKHYSEALFHFQRIIQSTNPAFSQRDVTYQKSLICTDLPSRTPTVTFCNGLFSQTHILETLTTTVLSTLTSNLLRLNVMNGAAALLCFCVWLGSNYFNYTVTTFQLMFGSY